MSRLTDGLPGPNGQLRIPQRTETKLEAKRFMQRCRSESGTTYERIANATGRAMTHVYDAFNVNDDRRHLTYADLIALSRHSQTKQFVAHLLAPIEQGIGGKGPPDGSR